MADDNRWSDRDSDWRDDRSFSEPGMGRDGRWHRRGAGPRDYGDGGRDSPGYNPAGPAQGVAYSDQDYRRRAGGDENYRAARAYQEGDPGFPAYGGRGRRGHEGSGGYSEARYDTPETEDYAARPAAGYREYRSRGAYERGPDYGYGPYTPYGAITEGETSSDYRHPAPQAWRGDGAPRHAGEPRSWIERTGEKLGHFVRDITPPDLRAGEHHGRGPKGYKRPDQRIHEDVADRLTEDGFLDASDIDITVAAAEVTLTGTVPDRPSKRRAEDLADTVTGVIHVQNNLRVKDREVSETEAIIDGTGVAPEV